MFVFHLTKKNFVVSLCESIMVVSRGGTVQLFFYGSDRITVLYHRFTYSA